MGHGPYTPPAEVRKLRKEKSLLPALYAVKGDFILLSDNISSEEISLLPYYQETCDKKISVVSLSQLSDISKDVEKIIPWGWDYAICQTLHENGVPSSLLPSKGKLEKIRELSHRRTSIILRNYIAEYMGESVYLPSKELFSTQEVENFLKIYPISYFKAPWSSSGRGIVVSDHIKHKGLLEWCHGIIRKQGSVIAEPAWDRTLDFATEWIIEAGVPRFLGYSVFHTSSRGKYHGNIESSQTELLKTIKRDVPSFNNRIIEAQSSAIKHLLAPYYEGFLGIDMLADTKGKVNPCVEINLRLTMGHISILKNGCNCR